MKQTTILYNLPRINYSSEKCENFTMRVKVNKNKILLAFIFLVIMVVLMEYIDLLNSVDNVSKPISYTFILDNDELDNTSLSDNNDNGTGLKYYILQWTSPRNVPFVFMGKGQQGFIDRKCPYTNCYVTGDRKYFGGDLTKFDVIAFAAPEVFRMSQGQLPNKRSPHQKYAFASIESSDYYPICSNKLNGFFNWTWTYRVDSEVRWGYMVIRDKDNKVVGPGKDMKWIKFKDMDPVSDDFKHQLKSKTKPAAWFVSNCHSRSRREMFVKDLQRELKQYDLSVDVYGRCGPLKCSRADEAECFNIIKEQYYFYLSFENAFSEDYVTEKLLNAVQNDAVPIVYGGANYSRFLPEGSYLNARELGAANLAAKINSILKNINEYYDYFRWKKYYSYHLKWKSVETDEYCLFCTTLNDKRLVKERKVYQEFKAWWNPPNRC